MSAARGYVSASVSLEGLTVTVSAAVDHAALPDELQGAQFEGQSAGTPAESRLAMHRALLAATQQRLPEVHQALLASLVASAWATLRSENVSVEAHGKGAAQ